MAGTRVWMKLLITLLLAFQATTLRVHTGHVITATHTQAREVVDVGAGRTVSGPGLKRLVRNVQDWLLPSTLAQQPETHVPLMEGGSTADPLWLRYSQAVPNLGDYKHIRQVAVDAGSCRDRAALQAVAAELAGALSGLLGRAVPGACCGCGAARRAPANSTTLLVSVGRGDHSLGPEGFAIAGQRIVADTASGALYGAFRFLSLVQRHRPLPANLTTRPAMKVRAWNLWDTASGRVEQGHAGNSLLWPYALYDEARPPPRNQLFVATRCNASDPYQQWTGATFGGGGPSAVRNVATGECLTSMSCDPVTAGACAGPASAQFFYNATNRTISLAPASSSGAAAGHCGRAGTLCLDLNQGDGPDIDLWACHGEADPDHVHQRFEYDAATRAIRPARGEAGERCLTVLRSAPLPDAASNADDPWAGGQYKRRVEQLFRLLKSAGMNTVVLNDVNACGPAGLPFLQPQGLANWTRNLCPLLDKWQLTPMLSLCFAAPSELSNVSSDPRAPAARAWWAHTFAQIYAHCPRFGGVVVKADSEGNVGPQSYNRTEAEGANMLARVIKAHGGVVLWRAFIYGDGLGTSRPTKIGKEDLARQAFDTFKPLDGAFDDNVVLQIKSGPYDFQVREPLHPLLGGMHHTNVMMEVSANQGYTGHQIHVVNFAQQWKTYLQWDTRWNGSLTIADLLTAKERGGQSRWGGGLACVSNIGNWNNYTGHILAAANTYACGRLAWDPSLPAETIDREWAAMTFGTGHTPDSSDSDPVVDTAVDILGRSWLAYEGYTSPMGIGFVVGQNNPYGCAPPTNRSRGGGEGPDGGRCPKTIVVKGDPHYWMNPCDDYDFSNYSSYGLGCDRTSQGTGSRMTDTYSPGVRALLDDPSTIPPELLLFFHNLAWAAPVVPFGAGPGNSSERVTVFRRIRDRHAGALEEVRGMAAAWGALEAVMAARGDAERFEGVRARLAQQTADAAVFRGTLMAYYEHLSGME